MAGLTIQTGIAVVSPVRDDPQGAVELLDALAAQTRTPDEVIIVDDGSVDGTSDVLRERMGSPVSFRIVNSGGVGIAGARNLGISVARQQWIACTDAGCVPVPGWLEAIEQASGEADFVAGSVIIDSDGLLQRVLAISAFPRSDELDHPSLLVRISHPLFGRGVSADRTGGGYMAFRRTVWESVGGFPLGLRSSDDRAFSAAVARAGFRMVRAPGAVVHWRPRSTLIANLGMFYNYSRGDVRVRPRRRHFVRALAYSSATLVVRRGSRPARGVLVVAALAYVWLPFRRAGQDHLPVRHWWSIPVVIALKDLAQIAGAGAGMIDAAWSKHQWRQGRPG